MSVPSELLVLSPGGNAKSLATSYTPDPHAVSDEEARSYYAGLPSQPRLLYRTGKKWSPPKGPEAQCRLKELREVFKHPIAKLWNDGLCWEVVKVMEAHNVLFTSIDVIRFKMVEVDEDADEDAKPVVSPVTVWIGVLPGTTSATAAHNAAQDVLALLNLCKITDVDVDFRESIYRREAGPQLLEPVDNLDPLADVISPLTPALGLPISTRASPNAHGTMALYLTEGGNSNKLLGLMCRHVLNGSEGANFDYTLHPNAPSIDVILLGKRAYIKLVDSIKLKIRRQCMLAEFSRSRIEGLEERERGTNDDDVKKARQVRVETRALLNKVEATIKALEAYLREVEKNWSKLDNRVLGPILRSPAIRLGVSEQRFTEDWGIFKVDQAKLGEGFQGNKIDLGTRLTPEEFIDKCYTRGDANWQFQYPVDGLLPLQGIITDKLMRSPDMWDLNGEPCLLVVKSGNTTNTTLGRANGVFSIVRRYFLENMPISATSVEWGIVHYDSESGGFSKPGDSGSIIADIRGRIGGMLTGGAGDTESSDMTYATPFWWLLERIKANGFPNAHFNIVK